MPLPAAAVADVAAAALAILTMLCPVLLLIPLLLLSSCRHVAEPYTRRYSQWQLQHLLGKSGTEGTYNQRLYKFGVSKAAEHPRDLEDAYKPRIQ
jgi:hypothetical protein